MKQDVEQGEYVAVPFDRARGGDAKWQTIVAAVAEHPHWFNGPTAPEERERIAAHMLLHPDHLTWEVWKGGELVGGIMLWRISPKCDALLHFAFFDRKLLGKARLLRRFLRYCFDDLGFQRITVEVPQMRGQGMDALLGFCRSKLKFRYEGEGLARNPNVREIWEPGKEKSMQVNPHVWIASQGSRRERAHYHDGAWCDVLCLRITAPEFRIEHGMT